MDTEPQTPRLSVDELRAAAASEDWDTVDAALPGVCDSPEYLAWAANNMQDDDGNVRDLAVSMFEKSSIEPDPAVMSVLETHMRDDENPYVRYRSAFALFQHDNHSPEVIETIRAALEDEDVAKIAQGYLDQLKRPDPS